MAMPNATPVMMKQMTYDEINAELLKQLPEEIEDSNHYFMLAKAASCTCHECEMHNSKELADGLFEISMDEYTHAKFIHNHLMKSCITIPDDIEHKYQALHNRAEDMYEPILERRVARMMDK